MRKRIFTRPRRRIAAAVLALTGTLIWAAAVAVYMTPADARDVSIPHIATRLVAVVSGGATITGAIVLAAAG